jgi:hypothetical protein
MMSTFLKFLLSTPNGYLLDEGSDPGTPSPSTSDPTTQGSSPTQSASGTATQPATQAATQPPAQGGSDDRSGWVPPYRLREAREQAERRAQEAYYQRESQLRSEMEQMRTKLHALVGVQAPQNPEVDAIRSQFSQLYPGLAKLEERAPDFQSLLERANELELQNNHYWQSYGRNTLDRLYDHASTSLGSPLSDEGKRQLRQSFVGFVQSSPEMTERYASDPTIVEDFWKQFTSNFIDPVRRASTATVAGRAAQVATLPQDRPGGAPQTSQAPKLNGLDERVAAGWADFQQRTGRT